MFALIFGTQVIGGALLVLGVAVPFALVILAPVIVNIVAFHVFLRRHYCRWRSWWCA